MKRTVIIDVTATTMIGENKMECLTLKGRTQESGGCATVILPTGKGYKVNLETTNSEKSSLLNEGEMSVVLDGLKVDLNYKYEVFFTEEAPEELAFPILLAEMMTEIENNIKNKEEKFYRLKTLENIEEFSINPAEQTIEVKFNDGLAVTGHTNVGLIQLPDEYGPIFISQNGDFGDISTISIKTMEEQKEIKTVIGVLLPGSIMSVPAIYKRIV